MCGALWDRHRPRSQQNQRDDEAKYLDGSLRDVKEVLGSDKDVVPEPGLQMALHLGQVEVGPGALGQQRLGVVEEEDSKVEDGSWDGPAVHDEVVLGQMPPSGPDHQCCMLQAHDPVSNGPSQSATMK